MEDRFRALAPELVAFLVSPPATPTIASAKAIPDSRLERIDVLRASAALIVVLHHFFGAKFGFFLPWHDGFRVLPQTSWHAVPLHLLSLGWAGVPLFFALSGFCIHAGFLRQQKFALGIFCWRRFWRIFPPYLLAVLVFAVWPINWLTGPHGKVTLLTNSLMIQNLHPATFWSDFNPSFWSVPTEFQCYLLYPVFLGLRKWVGIERAALGWFALGSIGKVIVGAVEGWPDHAIDFGLCFPLLTFGDWALGAWAAEKLFTEQDRRWPASGLIFAGAAALFILSTLWRPALSVSFSLATVCGAFLILNYASRLSAPNRFERVLGGIGIASYSLYLWHQPLLAPLEELGRNLASGLPLNLARMVTLLVIAAGLALVTFVSFRLIEKPAMAIAARRRTAPRPAPAT